MLEEYHKAVYASMRLAMNLKQIDYVPGCAELGDFDATSTAIGVYPCGELANIPRSALLRTFDRYFEFFESRRDGRLDWKDYTPYEIRIAGTFIRLGQPERAHAMLDYFFRDQRSEGWNQWAEVVGHDPKTPRFIGDMPHTWVGSEFLQVVRSMFGYEDGQALILGAGLKPEWLTEADGVAISGFPTQFGTLSLSARERDGELTIVVGNGLRPAPDRCAFILPRGRGVERVTINGHPTEVRRAGDLGPAVFWDGTEATISVNLLAN